LVVVVDHGGGGPWGGGSTGRIHVPIGISLSTSRTNNKTATKRNYPNEIVQFVLGG